MTAAVIFYKKNSHYQKRKANSNNKYYNYYQKGHYSQDYQFSNWKKKINNSTLRQYKNQKSLHPNTRINKVIEHSNDFNPKPFFPKYITSALVAKKKIKILEKPDKTWYLGFRAF